MNKKIILVLLIVLFTTGFTKNSTKPRDYYRVYLKGESLGLIESKASFEKYIDKKQEEIKQKYNVNKVYIPTELDILKETTFENNVKTNKEIYEQINDISPFTINGYTIKIKGLDTKDQNNKTVSGPTNTIYTLNKDIFTKSIEKTVKSFVSPED